LALIVDQEGPDSNDSSIPKTNPVREAFDEYKRAGLELVRVRRGEKRPSDNGWQKKTYTRDDFGPYDNLGVKGGSGNLVTVDLDADETRAAADILLPRSLRSGHGGIFGHAHFHVPDLPKEFYFKLNDHDGKTLVELRGDKGHQTLLPPSVHPSGEPYEWDGNYDPSRLTSINAEALLHRVQTIATVAIIVRNMPAGGRHDLANALAGLLLENGMDDADAETILETAWEIAGADHDGDLDQAVPDTREKIDNGEPYTHGRHVDEEILSKPVAKAIRKVWAWKHYKKTSTNAPKSAADELVALGLEITDELFKDQYEQPYARISGRSVPVDGLAQELRARSYKETGKAAPAEAINNAVQTLKALALTEGAEHELETRWAQVGDAIYYETSPGRVWRLDRGGWQIDDNPPVRFRNVKLLKALPDPEAGGTLEDLNRYIKLEDRELRLYLSVLVCTPSRASRDPCWLS
jgi:hypothetical protein